MCVAVVIPEGAPRPSLADHEKMAEANDDGAGYAWVDKDHGVVRWRKGFKSDDFATVHAEIEALPPGPVLLHYRIATVGGAVPALTHPFPVSRKAGTNLMGFANSVMIHNGHWAAAPLRLIRKGEVSDTRVLAMIAHDDPDVLARLAGQYGRSARLYADCTVDTHGHWTERGGVMYSNTLWDRRVYRPRRLSWYDSVDLDDTAEYALGDRYVSRGREMVQTASSTPRDTGLARAMVVAQLKRQSASRIIDVEPLFTEEELAGAPASKCEDLYNPDESLDADERFLTRMAEEDKWRQTWVEDADDSTFDAFEKYLVRKYNLI